jgi:hypothetical protein
MKPLRMIKVNNVGVSEKMLTLTIKDKSEITPIIRKAIIEEVLDGEAPTLVANRQPISDAIIEKMPSTINYSEDSNEEPLKVVTLESEEDKMIIAYIKGEPVIGIFGVEDTLFTGDHDYPKYDYGKNSSGI